MIHFIRDLNMIYDNNDKANQLAEKKLSLENSPVDNAFNSTKEPQDYGMPGTALFVAESKHHIEDADVVLSELVSESPVEDFAMEKFYFCADSHSCELSKETLKRLSFTTNEFKLDCDWGAIDHSAKEDDVDDDNNPVEKIIYTVQPIEQVGDVESTKGEEVEQVQCKSGENFIDSSSFQDEEYCENETILRCISEIRGYIPKSKLSDEESDGSPKTKRHISQVSFHSNASGGSFTFPILVGGLTESPRLNRSDSGSQRQIVRVQRKHAWYPSWRGLTCFRAI